MSGLSRAGSRPFVPAYARRTALLGAALLGFALAGAAPALAQAPTALVVGVAGPSCAAPTHPTVVAAVAAAAAGATITVCPGVYVGTVVVDKPLTFLGAQRGVDARTGRVNPGAESVVDGGGSTGFRITGTVSGVTIDGFTIRNAGTPTQNADGIDAFSGGSGFTVTNNIITQTAFGMNINSTGAAPSAVTRNRFVDNNRSGGQGGSGVFVSSGPGNNLAISDNLFTGHSSAAVNTAGDSTRPSTGLKIERNQSLDDATFAVVVNTSGVSVAGNAVVRTPLAVQGVGSAIFVGGGNTGAQIVRNVVSGGAANGIRVVNAFGPPEVGLVVSGNQVSGRLNGIRLTGQTSGTVSGNTVGLSTAVGILLDAGNSGVTVTRNVVGGSGVLDCRDDSTGTGTAGTANTWTANVALRSTPRGICGFF